jgi:uncharacterized protein
MKPIMAFMLLFFAQAEAKSEVYYSAASPQIIYITGMAARFNEVDNGADTVHRGAFRSVVEAFASGQKKIPLWIQHRPDLLIGEVTRLTEASDGLYFEAFIDLSSPAFNNVEDKMAALSRLRGVSYGYRAIKTERRGRVRILKEVELFEISLTESPMLPSTYYEIARAISSPIKCNELLQ